MTENTCVFGCNNCVDGHDTPLTDWEKELLTPDPNLVIHMHPTEGMTGCGVKLDDGKTHAVNSNIEHVSCGDCKIKWLTYVNEDLKEQVANQKERVRVANQATSVVRTELRKTHRRLAYERGLNRRLEQDLNYLRDRVNPGYYTGYRPVPRDYNF